MSIDTIAAVAAVAVGAVFVVSSVAKFASPARWSAEASAMGVPRLLVPVVPYAEVVLAAWLIVQWHRRAAALAAIAVLAVFSGLVVVRLAQGRRPVCACFGVLSARPIGPGTLLRNAVFAAVAAVAALA